MLQNRIYFISMRSYFSSFTNIFMLTLAACLCYSLEAKAVSFSGLGFLPGHTSSLANSVSSNGLTVAGTSRSPEGQREAFRWTSETGLIGLGNLPEGNSSYADGSFGIGGISADGRVVVGASNYEHEFGAILSEATIWESSAGITGLGRLNAGDFGYSFASGVSANGTVVVGSTSSDAAGGNYEAFLWTQDIGMTGLGFLGLSSQNQSFATDVSSNGNIVVGVDTSSGLPTEAFRWTQETGMVGLGDLPGGFVSSSPTGVSPDGSVVVGASNSVLGFEAFRWTQDDGMVGLGLLDPADSSSTANAASLGGAVIVGYSYGDNGSQAFIWNENVGMKSLQDMLSVDYGLNLNGWTLTDATSISDNGKTLVGFGTNPAGNTEAWIVDLSGPISVLDQESFGPPNLSPAFRARIGSGNGLDRSQTFTVGISGTLEAVELYLNRNEQTTSPLLLDIRAVNVDGSPVEGDQGADILGSLEILAADISISGGWVDVNLSTLGIMVEAGQQLALTLQSDEDLGADTIEYAWAGSREGTYAEGVAYDRSSGAWAESESLGISGAHDLYFRTFVQPIAVPEPTTAMLALLSTVGLLNRSKRTASA